MRASKIYRLLVVACASPMLLMGSLPSHAQQAEDDDKALDEITVTGSFIKRSAYSEAGSPIDVLDRDDIVADVPSGKISDFLRYLPQNVGNSATRPPGGGGGPREGTVGAGTIDLRGFGAGATLVLLNGQRHTRFAQSLDGRVNINNLVPTIMIDRVEILKDGASATYGSDAVAGVVNFRTRSQFEGVELRADARGTAGATVDTFDHSVTTLGAIFGGSMSDDIHIVAGVEYTGQSNLEYGEVDQIDLFNDLNAGSGFGQPGSYGVPLRDATGAFTGVTATIPDPDCQRVNDENITQDPAYPTATRVERGRCRLTFPHQGYFLEEDRVSGRAEVNWKVSDSVDFRGGFGFARSEAADLWQPTTPILRQPTVPGTHPANPFVAVDGNGNQLFAQDTDGDGVPDRDASGIVVLDPAGIAFNEDVLFIGRPYSQTTLGLSRLEQIMQTFRVEAGLSGDFSNSWSWDVGWHFSKEELFERVPDSVLSQLNLALNGQGGPGGDLTFNPFGSSLFAQPGDPTYNDPALENSIIAVVNDQHFTTAMTVDAILTGEAFDLPAGSVGLAFGVQYREEELEQDFDVLKTIKEVSFAGNGDVDFFAKEDTTAVFVEAAIPLMDSDAGALDLSVAGRFETKGGGSDTFNPKVSINFENDLLALRGSWSTSFLSPSLFQTFGIRAGRTNITDPLDNQRQQISTRIIGSQNLNDQESTSFNVGFTVDPTENLSLSADYWSFEFEDLLAAPSAQGILLADPSGPLVERNTLGNIVNVTRIFFNAGSIETDGIDFKGTYTIPDTRLGSFYIEGLATLVTTYDVQEIVGGPVVDGIGQDNNDNIGRPNAEWRGNVRFGWNNGAKQSATLTARYFSDVTRNINGNVVGGADAEVTFDAVYSYDFEDLDLVVSGGALNVFNHEPNIATRADFDFFLFPFQDPRGRQVFVNLSKSFN